MICSNCDNYKLLLELEEFIVSNKPAASRYIQTIIEECFRIAHEDFRCNGCGGLVVKGESYIKDNDKYKKLISEYYVKYDPYNLASIKHRKMFFHYAERYEPNFQGNHDDHDDDDDLTMPPDVCQLAQTPWSSGLGDLRRDYNQDKSVAMSDPLCKKLEEYIQNNYSQKKYYTLSKNRLIFRARPSPINKSLGKGDMKMQ
jgi:hypothetical protein